MKLVGQQHWRFDPREVGRWKAVASRLCEGNIGKTMRIKRVLSGLKSPSHTVSGGEEALRNF